MVALLPDRDLGIALLWNSESSLPTGMLPTMLDRAIGLSDRAWLDSEFDEPSLFAGRAAQPGSQQPGADDDAGTTSTKTTASPE